MNENQRLKNLMELLHFKTQKDFAAALNIQQGSLSDILRERVNVSNAIKDRLEMKFDVNLTWLEDGIGEPFFKKKPAVGESKEGVPYFDMSLSDGLWR
jgi:transcriptional regulator with XRE-family HTH domain